MLALLLRHMDLTPENHYMGDLTFLPLLECGWWHTLSDAVIHWHYNLGKQKRKYFPFPITQCIRCEMNAMVDEAQQAVDLTTHRISLELLCVTFSRR